MNFKKTTISTAIILSLLGATQANQFQIIVSQDKNKYDVIESQEPVPTDWENVGSPYSCVARFNADDYNLGTTFTQIEDCKQKQERTVVIKEVFNGEERYRTITEERIVDVENTYLETGTKNFDTGQDRIEYTEWLNDGSHYDCGNWSPLESTINLNEDFTQNRDCNQDQDRMKDVYNIWADGSEILESSNLEEQTISESESQPATGTKNYITEQQRIEYSEWGNTGIHYDCNTWNPLDSTVNLGVEFTQNRDCSQDQDRNKDTYDIWADGSETLNNSLVEIQTLIESESQQATGTKNYKTGTQRTEYTEWTNTGTHYNCDAFSPLPSEVYTGTSYTQNRNCSQDQNRIEDIYDVWADGSETLYTSTPESQTIIETESNQAVGTLLAQSCKQILNSQGSTGNGTYSIYIDSSIKTVNCDMTTDGGGWTIVADQNLYVEGYAMSTSGLPDDNPNNTQNTRFTRWPKYTEYAIKSVIDLHGATYDASVAPEFRKFNTGSFGEVEVDIIGFYLDKNDFQEGRASNNYVMYNGVPWGDSNSHDHYYGYLWFGQSGMTYNHWGQADVWGHIVNSNLFRIASTETGYARTGSCGASWAQNNCRLAMSAWVNRSVIKQKAVFMVR